MGETTQIPTPTPQPETPQQTINNTNQTPQPKNKNHHVIFIIGLIICLIIGGGFYFLSLSTTKAPNSTNQPAIQTKSNPLNNPVIRKLAEKLPIPKITMIPITITPTIPQPTSHQTTPILLNKTYTNKENNFSIAYPENETIQENDHGFGVIDVALFDHTHNSSAAAPEIQFLLTPKTIADLIGQNFDQLYSLPSPSAQIMQINKQSQQFTKIQNRTIAGLRAFDFTSTSYPVNPNEQPQVGAFIELGDNLFTISTSQSNQAILDAMLASFKYTP